MTNKYSNDSIKTLDYFEHIRKYPGMYIGSKTSDGLHHLVKEIVSNSVDEYLNGAGTTVKVTIMADGSIKIEDDARGIPIGEHSKGISTLRACFGMPNTGGKFNNVTGQTGYNTSGGEHGLGAKAVNALSTKLVVSTSNGKQVQTVTFSRGKFVSEQLSDTPQHSGLSVWFYPDGEVLETTNFDAARIMGMLEELSYLSAGLKFVFKDERTGISKTYLSKNGMRDFINSLKGKRKFLFEPLIFSREDGTFKVDVAFAYCDGSSGVETKLYTNNVPQERGTHLTGFKTAFTSSVNSIARACGLLKEKDENLKGKELESGQLIIINFKMIDPIFKGQNKEELTSSEGRTYVQRLCGKAFDEYFASHRKELKIIVDRGLSFRKAKAAANKAMDRVLRPKANKQTLKEKLSLSDKYIGCSSKNPAECELLLVEGNSACSSAVEARDPKTQAIMMLRGKVINALRSSEERVLKNQEYHDIIQAIGAGFGKSFDVRKMNFDKIVITSDAK